MIVYDSFNVMAANITTRSQRENENMSPKCDCLSLLTYPPLMKRKWLHSALLVITLNVILVPVVKCQQQNDTHSQPGGGVLTEPDNTDSRPIDKAMDPLYIMTKEFLNILQPVSEGFILEEADIVDDVVNGNFEVVAKSIGTHWKTWVQHYIGFVVCAAIGVLFIVIMPIFGLCFCCCRCCGNCGGHGDPDEKRGDRCKRGACGTILLIITLIILAGMVCGFVTNELLREQTTAEEDQALLNTISLELSSLNSYKDNTVKELSTSILGTLQTTATDIINEIKNAATNAKDELGTITDSTAMLDSALQLAQTAELINSTMMMVKYSTESLISSRGNLVNNLTASKTAIENTLSSCGTPECNDLLTQIQALNAQADFAQTDDVSEELQHVQSVLGSNLAQLILNGKQDFEDIATDIEDDIQSEIDQFVNRFVVEAESEVNNIETQIEDEIDKIIAEINKIQLNGTDYFVDVKPTVEEYGNYRYYGGIALCCVLLLIILFGLLGLCFGVCGESAGDDAPACNRGVGATILMVGVAFSFLFAWIVMILVLIFFLLGGVLQTEVCRYALDLPNAPQPIQNTLNLVVGQQLESLNLHIELTQVIRDCENNKAIYESLNLSSIVNVSQVLDINQYGLKSTIDDLVASVNVDLSGVVIFSNSTRQELNELINSGLININFTSYLIQLNAPITSVNLTQLADDLDALANTLEPSASATAQDLRAQAMTLRTIEGSTIKDMLANSKELRKSVTTLIAVIQGPPDINSEIQQMINVLDKAQKNIQQNGTELIKQFIRDYGDRILNNLSGRTQELAREIEEDIGRCRPVYEVVDNLFSAACVTVLYPFNGFWFSLGMCLIFLIPFIIVSVCLVSLYRKTDEYFDDKSFDDVNYDAYTGVYPGDNIPLEDVNPRKNRAVGGASSSGYSRNPPGIQNAAYVPDVDYPLNSSQHLPSRSYRDHTPPAYNSSELDSYPLGGTYPGHDYYPSNPNNPPHYNYNNRSRMY